MQILMNGATRLELQDSLMASLMIDDLHRTVLFDPQLTHDDVMDGAIDVGPRVGFTPFWQSHGDETSRLYLDRFAPKLQLWIDRAVEREAR